MTVQKKAASKRIPRLTAPLYLLSIVLLSCISFQATAGMVWQTTKASLDSDGGIYNAIATHERLEGVLLSVDYNDSTPSPCYGVSCIITTGIFQNTQVDRYIHSSFLGGNIDSIYHEKVISTFRTMGELYQYLRDIKTQPPIAPGLIRYGTNASTYFGNSYCDPGRPGMTCYYKDRMEAFSHICFALAYNHASGGFYTSFPGQSCIGPTPPNNECVVGPASVTLDHGELLADAVEGNTKNQQVNITCTYPANANVAFYSKEANEKITLNSDGSLYSTLTIDGVSGPVGKKISIPQSGATIVLESTLHTVGDVAAGTFSGSGILVINSY